jgi:hypothetical protein
MIYVMGAPALIALLAALAYAAGWMERGARDRRRAERQAEQAAAAVSIPVLPRAGRLRAVPDYEDDPDLFTNPGITFSEISAGWDELERQQRGWSS